VEKTERGKDCELVEQASACLVLTSDAIKKFKRRQREIQKQTG
jgi:hypothetical protein